MHNFRELIIWKEAMKIAKVVYVVSARFPATENYGLIAQIRRSAVSVPSNIAEGAGRNSDKQFLNFISIAVGSAYELETQLLLSVDLGYVGEDDIKDIVADIILLQKKMYRFQEQLREKIKDVESLYLIPNTKH